MWDMEMAVPPTASLPRQLPQLSSLQELELDGAVVYPSLLSGMLVVNSCQLLPGGDAAAGMAAAAALLAAVGCLKHLTQLRIMCDRSDFDHDQNLNAGDPAAYTALTASSALRELAYASKGHSSSALNQCTCHPLMLAMLPACHSWPTAIESDAHSPFGVNEARGVMHISCSRREPTCMDGFDSSTCAPLHHGPGASLGH
jgi:hypothetical protein